MYDKMGNLKQVYWDVKEQYSDCDICLDLLWLMFKLLNVEEEDG